MTQYQIIKLINQASYLEAAGTDDYSASATPTLLSYQPGTEFNVKFANANTGPATLNVDGLGALSITKEGSTPLDANDIKAGEIKKLVCDGARLQIVGGNGGAGGVTQNITSFAGNIAQSIM